MLKKLSYIAKQCVGILTILAIMSSFAPAAEIIGQWGTGEYYEVHVDGNIAYCAASRAGVDILDVSDPGNPSLISNMATQGRAYGIFIVDNLAYVSDGRNDLKIFDVSNPAEPVLLGNFHTDAEIHRVQVVGDRAYIASIVNGVEIVDVSNPEAPFSLGLFGQRGVTQFFVVGTTIYMGLGPTLHIMDLQDLDNPHELAHLDGFSSMHCLWITGSIAYIANGRALTAVDISNPAAPEIIGHYETTGYAESVHVVGNRAYVTDSEDGLLVLDISDPTDPTFIGRESTPGSADDVYVNDEIAYIADGYRGLRLIDISKSVMPGTLGSYDRSGNANGVWSDGYTAYLAAGESGLQIFDVRNPVAPIRLGSYYDNDIKCVQAIRTKTNHKAYVGAVYSFKIIDLTNPARPVRIGNCSTSYIIYALHVVGNYAYLAGSSGRNGGLQVVDISDPSSPHIVGSYNIQGDTEVRGIDVIGTTVFLSGYQKLFIIDVSDPSTPVALGTYDNLESASDVQVIGSTAYVSNKSFSDDRSRSSGLRIINIENPNEPTLIGRYDIPAQDRTLKLEIVGDRAYLLNSSPHYSNRLEVIDISNPSQPKFIQALDLTDFGSLKIVDNLAYIAEGYSGHLSIIDLESHPANVYFPHADNSNGWETEIALLNANDLPTQGHMVAFDSQGEPVSEPNFVTLRPWQRTEFTLSQDFDNAEKISYLIFETGSHNLVGYSKFYNQESGYRVALPTVTKTGADTLYVSHIASNDQWWTGFALVNTTGAALNPIITFSDGTQHQISIAGGKHESFSVRDLYGAAPKPDLKYAVISDCAGIIGIELFGSIGDSHQLSGILLSNKLETTIYYPHIASDNDWWTGITAYDPFATNHSFTIKPYTSTGYPLAPKTINLEPRQKKYLNSASGIELPQNTAWIRLEATSGITGFELFGSHDGNQLGGYTGVGINSTKGIFAKIDQHGWTGIALVNSSPKTALVTLKARNNYGRLVASKKMFLSTNAKIIGTPENLFPDVNIGNATYISYQSDWELVGFQLNGDGLFLDALPALSH